MAHPAFEYEEEENITLSKAELDDARDYGLAHPWAKKLLRYFELRNKDVGKKLYDACVCRLDILADKISNGTIDEDDNTMQIIMDIMQKGASLKKGLESIQELSRLGMVKEEKKEVVKTHNQSTRERYLKRKKSEQPTDATPE